MGVSTTHQNAEDCLYRSSHLGNSCSIFSSRESCPVRMVLTSAVEFGSREPESVGKNSSASKKRGSMDGFLHHSHARRIIVSLGGVESWYSMIVNIVSERRLAY